MINNNSFNVFNKYANNGIAECIKENNARNLTPIIVCVGSDLVLGDSLGPLVGTFIKEKNKNVYVYGTLNYPITAKEIEYVRYYLRKMHPNSIIIAIDAAVGSVDDVGTIRVANKGLKPGLGVNKDLDEIGDISVIGVVAGRSDNNYNLFNLTRLNLIYKMADVISDGIAEYVGNEKFLKSALIS